MKILELEHKDDLEGWNFSPVTFRDVNLFVGASGAGKSKMLNVLFTIARKVVQDSPSGMVQGYWRLRFEHNKRTFLWEYECKSISPTEAQLTKDIVTEVLSDGQEEILIDRNANRFQFKTNSLPTTLSKTSFALHILKDDPAIVPAFEGFKRIARRNFFGDELQQAAGIQDVPAEIKAALKRKKSLETLFGPPLTLGVRLYFLQEFFPAIFKTICDSYQSIFPFIESFNIKDLKQVKHNLPGLLKSIGLSVE